MYDLARCGDLSCPITKLSNVVGDVFGDVEREIEYLKQISQPAVDHNDEA